MVSVPSRFSLEPRPYEINMGISAWKVGRLLWYCLAFNHVLKICVHSTGGSRPPILRLHSDKASEFLTPAIRAHLSQQGVRQTVNSGYDPEKQSGVGIHCFRKFRKIFVIFENFEIFVIFEIFEIYEKFS